MLWLCNKCIVEIIGMPNDSKQLAETPMISCVASNATESLQSVALARGSHHAVLLLANRLARNPDSTWRKQIV